MKNYTTRLTNEDIANQQDLVGASGCVPYYSHNIKMSWNNNQFITLMFIDKNEKAYNTTNYGSVTGAYEAIRASMYALGYNSGDNPSLCVTNAGSGNIYTNSYADGTKIYTWNGSGWQHINGVINITDTSVKVGGSEGIQVTSLPTASLDLLGKIKQYIGATSGGLTNGYFYQCQEVTPATTPATYHWVAINVQAGGSGEPELYIKSAEVEDNKLNLKNKDDTITVYEPDLSSYRLAYEQDIIDNAAKDRLTAIEEQEQTWNDKSDVAGDYEGDNWTKININGVEKNIPQGGSSSVQFDNATIIQGADGKYKTAIGGSSTGGVQKFSGTGTVNKVQSLTFSSYATSALAEGDLLTMTITVPGGEPTDIDVEVIHDTETGGSKLDFNHSTEANFIIQINYPTQHQVTIKAKSGNLDNGDYSVILKTRSVISKVNANYLPIDGDTITIDGDGNLMASAGATYTAGPGIKLEDGEISTNFGGNLEREDTEEIFQNKPLQKVTNDFYEATDVEGITLEDIAQYHGTLTVMGDFYETYSLSHGGKRTIDGVETQCIYAYLDSYASYDVYLIQPTEGSYSGKIGILFENLPIEIDVSESALSVYVYSEDVSYINAAVIPLDTGTMERLPNGDIAAIIPEYNAGNGINIDANNSISTKVSFTYDSSTGTLAITYPET